MSSIYILLEPKALLADLLNSWKPNFAPPESCTQKWTLIGSSVDYNGSLKKHKSHLPCNVGRRAEDGIFLLSLLSIYLLLSSSCKSNRRNLQWCKGWNLFEILSFKSLRFLIKLRLVFWKEASLCLSTPIFFYWYFVNIWSPPFLIKAKSIYSWKLYFWLWPSYVFINSYLWFRQKPIQSEVNNKDACADLCSLQDADPTHFEAFVCIPVGKMGGA